jgi:hypothetical protein
LHHTRALLCAGPARSLALYFVFHSPCAATLAQVHKREDAERVALRLDDVERTTVVIRSLFLIDRELGLWILEQV